MKVISMPIEAQEILRAALMLSAQERVVLADQILSSVSGSESQFDRLWSIECEERLAAYRSGKMKAIPAEDVFAEIDSL